MTKHEHEQLTALIRAWRNKAAGLRARAPASGMSTEGYVADTLDDCAEQLTWLVFELKGQR